MKLEDAADLIMGQSPPSSTYNSDKIGLPFYQGKTDFGFINPEPRIYCEKPQKISEENDILISIRAPVGPVNMNNRKACIGRGLAAIRASKADTAFLFYNLIYQQDYIASLGSGSTFHAINKTQLGDIEIPELQIFEQRKIAAILSTVRKAIENQQALIDCTSELKKAMMHKLFTEGTKGEKQKMTEIGLVPESWEIKKIGDIAVLKSGATPSRAIKEYWENGKIPWVKTGEVDYCIINDAEGKITSAGLENSAAKIFPAGTLLMAMYGQGITRGKVAILGIDAATNQACAAFFLKPGICTEYLYFYLQDKYENIRNLGHGANQKNLSADIIKSFTIAYPKDLAEQEIIYKSLDFFNEKLTLHSVKKVKLEELFRTLLHQLMTAEIRVDNIDLNFLKDAA